MKNVFLNAGLSSLAEQMFNKEISHLLSKYGFMVYMPQEVLPPGISISAAEIYRANLKAIQDADLLISILDKPGLGVVYELGYALANSKKVIMFRSDVQDYLGKIIEGVWEITDSQYKARDLLELEKILQREGGFK